MQTEQHFWCDPSRDACEKTSKRMSVGPLF